MDALSFVRTRTSMVLGRLRRSAWVGLGGLGRATVGAVGSGALAW
jgi:hypothetical protein